MFCKYISDIKNSFEQIFFLDNAGGKISFNSVGKMFHIFGPKLDIFSEPFMTVLIFLPCNALLFRRL